jgi:hypothetical protein
LPRGVVRGATGVIVRVRVGLLKLVVEQVGLASTGQPVFVSNCLGYLPDLTLGDASSGFESTALGPHGSRFGHFGGIEKSQI